MKARPLADVGVDELVKHRVWEFDFAHETEEGHDDTCVFPVAHLPVSTLVIRVVVTQVELANGTPVTAMLGNISLDDLRRTKHFVCISVAGQGGWFHLARYFDVGYTDRGPEALARFLGLRVEEVFPISYDISDIAVGLPEVVRGRIPAEPEERLTRQQLMVLTFGRSRSSGN